MAGYIQERIVGIGVLRVRVCGAKVFWGFFMKVVV